LLKRSKCSTGYCIIVNYIEMDGDRMQETNTQVPQRPIKKSKVSKIILIGAILSIWIGLIFAGYIFIDSKIEETRQSVLIELDRSVTEVMETNALNIKLIEDKVTIISDELVELSSLLEETDENIALQNYFREAINEKMDELNIQLQNLEESLEMIKESK